MKHKHEQISSKAGSLLFLKSSAWSSLGHVLQMILCPSVLNLKHICHMEVEELNFTLDVQSTRPYLYLEHASFRLIKLAN